MVIEPIEFIRNEYMKRRQANAAYSMRAFARDLGISPARLSQVLSRKRTLTHGQLQCIRAAMNLDAATTQSLANFKKRPKPRKYVPIAMDHYRLIADWQHFAILSLLETVTGKNARDIQWIAKRLASTTVEIRQAIERLLNLDLIEETQEGYRPVQNNLSSTSEAPSTALRHFHHQMLDLAKHALDEQPIERRSVTAMTMAINSKKLPEAKEMIQEFRRNLCAFLEDGAADEVYSLNVQLFQLTKEI